MSRSPRCNKLPLRAAMQAKTMGVEIAHIELELGRAPEHPFGERGREYHLYLPLDIDGRLDLPRLKTGDSHHTVRRERPGELAECGRLVFDADGRLLFVFEDHPTNRQAGFQTPPDQFVVGHTVAIAEEDGEVRPFQVIAVRRE